MLSFVSDDEANSKENQIKAIESKIEKVEALKSICDMFIEKYQYDITQIDKKPKWGQILTSDIKPSRSFSYCNLTFLSSTINVFNLPTVLDIAE
ncbi:hypothetical protein [Pseudoalteromonas sp. SG44-17]|uniref:hypothetical protein n=1 Tax=Pseudoalteromonas sp. SG44-17 TaxID=2760963 RepID=UPI0015FF8A20|nr:hypothetical protein [Pseudoalteromonas sp. SG44-17]MBB1408225.1 hypothetical protein [Pseudoalteromonas sp. SG44-17]